MKRVDIISDTHGRLSPELMAVIKGADLVVHAGDITSEACWDELVAATKQLKACKGNNDYYYDYGPEVGKLTTFTYEGLRFAVTHYREELPLKTCDVAVCGHTHRPFIRREGRCTVINPGSPTFPRGPEGPTMARLFVEGGRIIKSSIIRLSR